MKCRSTFVLLLLLNLAAWGWTRAQQVAPPDVRDYVRLQPFDRNAYGELSTLYDASVTPELVAMLSSGAEEANWAKAAYALGAIGDQRAADALIAFVEKPRPDRTSKADIDARHQAIESLGFLVNRTGNERALTYLIDGLTPKVWKGRNIQGLPPAWWTISADEYDRLLSEYAILGLALSGNPRAGEALRSLQSSPTPDQAEFRKDLDDVLTQWLEVFELVKDRGVTGMYEYYEQRSRH